MIFRHQRDSSASVLKCVCFSTDHFRSESNMSCPGPVGNPRPGFAAVVSATSHTCPICARRRADSILGERRRKKKSISRLEKYSEMKEIWFGDCSSRDFWKSLISTHFFFPLFRYVCRNISDGFFLKAGRENKNLGQKPMYVLQRPRVWLFCSFETLAHQDESTLPEDYVF